MLHKCNNRSDGVWPRAKCLGRIAASAWFREPRKGDAATGSDFRQLQADTRQPSKKNNCLKLPGKRPRLRDPPIKAAKLVSATLPMRVRIQEKTRLVHIIRKALIDHQLEWIKPCKPPTNVLSQEPNAALLVFLNPCATFLVLRKKSTWPGFLSDFPNGTPPCVDPSWVCLKIGEAFKV